MTSKRNAKQRAPRLEALEQRLCLSSFVLDSSGKTGSHGWDGSAQRPASLTYYIAGTPPSNMTMTQTENALVAALETLGGGRRHHVQPDVTPGSAELHRLLVRADRQEGRHPRVRLLPEGRQSRGPSPGTSSSTRMRCGKSGMPSATPRSTWRSSRPTRSGTRSASSTSDVATGVMFPEVGADQQFTQLDPADDAAILQPYARAGSTPAKSSVPTKRPDLVYESGDDSERRPLP